MTSIYKVTKSKAIKFMLLTVSTVLIVSCGGHKPVTKSSNKGKTVTKKLTKYAPKETTAKVDKVITTARSYLGINYKFGGTTRNGLDCSGLMFCTFKSVDITLPRTSTEQSKIGKPIKLNDVQEGDLVFFTDKKGSSTITHVGMITRVEDAKTIKFIHASTKQGVVEENIFASYYLPFFVKAVRVL